MASDLTNKKLPELPQSVKNGKATLRRQQEVYVQYYGHTWKWMRKFRGPYWTQ